MSLQTVEYMSFFQGKNVMYFNTKYIQLDLKLQTTIAIKLNKINLEMFVICKQTRHSRHLNTIN